MTDDWSEEERRERERERRGMPNYIVLASLSLYQMHRCAFDKMQEVTHVYYFTLTIAAGYASKQEALSRAAGEPKQVDNGSNVIEIQSSSHFKHPLSFSLSGRLSIEIGRTHNNNRNISRLAFVVVKSAFVRGKERGRHRFNSFVFLSCCRYSLPLLKPAHTR